LNLNIFEEGGEPIGFKIKLYFLISKDIGP